MDRHMTVLTFHQSLLDVFINSITSPHLQETDKTVTYMLSGLPAVQYDVMTTATSDANFPTLPADVQVRQVCITGEYAHSQSEY